MQITFKQELDKHLANKNQPSMKSTKAHWKDVPVMTFLKNSDFTFLLACFASIKHGEQPT